MKDKKIVFFDIDGTLLDSAGVIPESTKKAMKELKENGHLRFICTGRPPCMIEDKLKDMDFDGIVCGAGSYVTYGDKLICSSEFTPDELELIISVLKEHHVEFILEGKDSLYALRVLFDDYSMRLSALVDKMRDLTKVIEDSETLSVMKLTSNFKVEDFEILRKVEEKLGDVCSAIIHDNMVYEGMDESSLVQIVEFVPKGINKAVGIKTTLEHLGITWENTYAFGDSNNDLEMLQYVNHSVAMGKSSQKAIEASRYQTDKVEDDGIYNGLHRLGLV